jgi:tripartite-type tricarboxylate transporter receptor subunit TctC
MLLAVHPSLPARSVKEFIAFARARPGKLNYGTGGSGTSAHIITELFKTTARVDLVHVPYKGTAQAATDLMAGQIQVMFIATSSALNYVRTGKLAALGVSTAQPSALAHGVPPLAQSGLPGFDASIWQGVLAPARTPSRIISVLNREIAGQLDLKEVREQFLASGAEPMSSTPERFGAYIKSEIERWGKVVKASGAKVD